MTKPSPEFTEQPKRGGRVKPSTAVHDRLGCSVRSGDARAIKDLLPGAFALLGLEWPPQQHGEPQNDQRETDYGG